MAFLLSRVIFRGMTQNPPYSYPFSAIVGQDRLKAALVVNAVDPSIGGVLIRGHKGTGKSTTVRALPGILPPIDVVPECPCNCSPDLSYREKLCPACRNRLVAGPLPAASRPMPFVTLPLNATEDRLAGTVHLEETLRTGARVFEHGLLAAANRGVLYVDEVNLLEDHLVDLLLDAAASGINIVEREGLSFSHPASFMLIGTMNPEEGELRPQFLDRFGLCVSVPACVDSSLRKTIIRQRLRFDSDPEALIHEWRDTDALLREQIRKAREVLARVDVPEEALDLAVTFAENAGARGHRAELAIIKTARALAAFQEKTVVTAEDLAEAARLSLLHRIEEDLAGTPEQCLGKLEKVIGGAVREISGPTHSPNDRTQWVEDDDELDESMQVPGNFAAPGMITAFLKKKLKSLPPVTVSAWKASTSPDCG